MNTEKSTSEDCKKFKVNAFRRCGINIGSRLCTKPQKKNKLVTKIKGKRYPLSFSVFREELDDDGRAMQSGIYVVCCEFIVVYLLSQ